MRKSVGWFLMVLLLFGSFAPFATAAFGGPSATSAGFYSGGYGSTVNTWQSSRPTFDGFYSGSMDTYWPILSNLEKDQCDSVTSDFIIAIPPMGCSPTVVRSDLLAEQNVPVFCQLSAIRVNPLIDVSTIKSISFSGDYPDEVAGISFHPARAAVSSYRTLIGSPIEENIGYVVIVLKRQPDERNLEKYISGMLTARIRYDAVGAFGTGASEYYLAPVGDDEWNRSAAAESSFWAGRGYVRAISIEDDEATLEVLTDKNDVYRTVTLKVGETSNRIYYPGQYCTAALKLKLNKIDNSEDMARIDIDGDNYWVRKGSRLLGGKCTVKDLNVFPGGAGEITIACSGERTFKLELANREVVLKNGTTSVNVMIGGSIRGSDEKDYYLGYYGKNKVLNDGGNNPSGEFVILFDGKITEDDVSEVTRVFEGTDFKTEDEMMTVLNDKKIFSRNYNAMIILSGATSSDSGITFVSIKGDASGGKYSVASGVPKYLGLARDTTMKLIDDFGSEKKGNGDAWGESVLYKQIMLAGKAGDTDMQSELIKVFLMEYPKSVSREHVRDLKLNIERRDFGSAMKNVFVNNNNYNIRVDGFVSGSGYSDSVDVKVSGRGPKSLTRGGVYDGNLVEITNVTKKTSAVPRLTVSDIDGKSAKFVYVWRDADRDKSTSTRFSIDVGDYYSVGGVEFGVTDTNVKEVAYVSLIPEIRNTKTEANFTFKIGIEERAFEISPESAKRKVKRLNDSINKWEDRIEKLGNLIKGLKAACFVTSTVLTLKTMFSGFVSGEALAREHVMDRYRARCRGEGHTKSVALQKCYSGYKGEIDAAIKDYGDSVTAVNKNVKCAENETTVGSGGFLETKIIDSRKYVERLSMCTGLSDSWSVTIRGTTITKGHLNDASDYQAVLLKEEACKKPASEACKMATVEMEKALSDNVDRKKVLDAKAVATTRIKGMLGDGKTSVKTPVVQSAVSKDVRALSWGGQTLDDYPDLKKKVEDLTSKSSSSEVSKTMSGMTTMAIAPLTGMAVSGASYTYELVLGGGVCDMEVCVKGIGDVLKTISGVSSVDIKSVTSATLVSSRELNEKEVRDALATANLMSGKPTLMSMIKVGSMDSMSSGSAASAKECEDSSSGGTKTMDKDCDMKTMKMPQKIQFFNYNGVDYLLLLSGGMGNRLSVTNAYKMQGKMLMKISKAELTALRKFVFVMDGKGDKCTNEMVTKYVKYHEKNNRQGFAAIVPFDIKEGWYAHIEKSDYTESGVVNAFWICNVGSDGIISDGAVGGDVCVRMSTSIGSDVLFTPCPKLTSSQKRRLYSKAEAAIREANRNGQGITIDGEWVGRTSPIGPASNGLECSDFMNVQDCNLMFNVCDPVICPPSRCDLGGAWKVSDVIQSGIIGSIALCLPNFGIPSEGGVVIPICLSGVHAGLDSYVSILRSYRDCLVRNIETGEYTGICDEITGVYMCEFFWGQISPILDHLAVRFVEALYGGFQTRGGAEYLTIQKSFDNVKKSIDYFTSTYAAGAFRAFQMRSVEEAGSLVCKGFVGTSFPTSADMIDSLLAPESPSQFYAYFSESLYSEATVPSSSHYKVYYHIYAGNDEGVQYRVYLKNPPESSYYSTRRTLLVDSGYVAKGVEADEAIDFTAPSGYKELCVSINGRDECGFGSVTSNFALNYASQAYINDQADDRGITSTEDCVTTSASAWGLVNPNLQAGVEGSIGQDDIANSGLVRICASVNPEQGIVAGNDIYCKPSKNEKVGDDMVNPVCGKGNSCEKINSEVDADVGVCYKENGRKMVSGGRWVDVGYCDNPSVRCWLDSESVEDNLGLYAAVNGIKNAEDLARNVKDLKELEEQYKNVREKLSVQKKAIGELNLNTAGQLNFKDEYAMNKDFIDDTINDIIKALDEIAGVEDGYVGQGSNANKAEALALKASVYRMIVDALIKANPELRVVGGQMNMGSGGGGLSEEKIADLRKIYSDRGSEIDAMVEVGLTSDEIEVRLETGDFGGVDDGEESGGGDGSSGDGVEVVGDKISWEELVEDGLAKEENGAKFVKILSRKDSFISVVGYTESIGLLVVNDGGRLYYQVSKDSGGNIVFNTIDIS